MLTNEEVKQIVDAHKEVFASKQDMVAFQEEMGEHFSDVLTVIDTYGAKADKYFQEMVILSRQVDRLEKWIQQIANKVGIELRS